MRRGLAALTGDCFGGGGWVQRLTGRSGSGPMDNQQLFIASVDQAMRNGADAVAPTIFLGGDFDNQVLPYFGAISDKCAELGMPLMAEVFPARGPGAVPYDGPYTVDDMRVVVRTACEEGCDLIKTWYSGDPNTFRKVVDYSTVPILVAGGPKAKHERDVLETIKGAMDAGAKGAIFGRKIWQAKDPAAMVRAVCRIVHEGADVTSAMQGIS
jgi:fructose-bisphosphate aldolase / 2-amino-3,7-dideoxy-D-threo-hept-6-ulosonate synthase